MGDGYSMDMPSKTSSLGEPILRVGWQILQVASCLRMPTDGPFMPWIKAIMLLVVVVQFAWPMQEQE